MHRPITFAFVASLVLSSACGGDGAPDDTAARREAVETYAEIVHRSYADSLETARALQTAIDAFVAAPGQATLTAAQDAWLAARDPYGQTEAYRFYGGPIDDAVGPEGRLNAWPLDEVYIDYVDGVADSGIVNDVTIEITPERLIGLNEGGGGNIFEQPDFDAEKAVATGYHAIEFLLWGQDLSPTGPGARPFEDYLVDASATAPNGDRRGVYLQTVAGILVDDLAYLVDEWAPDADNFRAAFTSGDPDDALRDILTGIGVLSKGELSSERMDVALDTLDQEDEHSCFSDNTHRDFLMNVQGIENVYTGRYGDFSGPSVSDLVLAVDAELGEHMLETLAATRQAVEAIPAPVDQAIAVRESPGWNAIDAAVNSLFDQGDHVVEIGAALGLGNISVELPE